MKITKDISGRSGSCLQGYLYAPEAAITKALGFGPCKDASGDGKVTIEWRANIGGTFVAIYDYKGESSPFHIGGHGEAAVWACQQIFGQAAQVDRF